MGLTLTSADEARFAAATRALLSLADASGTDAACRAALDRVRELLGVDRATFILPDGDGVRVRARGIERDLVERLAAVHTGMSAGANRYTCPKLERMMASLHERQCRLWDLAVAEQISGIGREEHPFYHEVAAPAGLAYCATATVPLPRGEAMLGTGYDSPDAGRFDRRARLGVLRMLRPALEAGVRALWQFKRRRATLDRTLDRFSDGLMVCDTDGRELHRNLVLCRMLEEDSRPEPLVAAMRDMAARLVALRSAGPSTIAGAAELPAPGMRTVETPLSRYTVRATYVAPGTFALDESILVTLERALPKLPTEQELRRRFELTPRQAEVALLVARGHSNAEIAARLTRSPHTVRHHIEHIFRKLGIRSRKALALRLLAHGGG